MKKWLLLRILSILDWLAAKVRAKVGEPVISRRPQAVMYGRNVQRHRYAAPISRTFSRRKFPAPIHIIGGEEDSE
jgi:hypothetical protein